MKDSVILKIERKKPIQNEDYDSLIEQLESTLWNEAEITIELYDLKLINSSDDVKQQGDNVE